MNACVFVDANFRLMSTFNTSPLLLQLSPYIINSCQDSFFQILSYFINKNMYLYFQINIFQNPQKNSKNIEEDSHIFVDITELHFVSGKMVHVIYGSRTYM